MRFTLILGAMSGRGKVGKERDLCEGVHGQKSREKTGKYFTLYQCRASPTGPSVEDRKRETPLVNLGLNKRRSPGEQRYQEEKKFSRRNRGSGRIIKRAAR